MSQSTAHTPEPHTANSEGGNPYTFRVLFSQVRAQSFWIVSAYLALGTISEIMRGMGSTSGSHLERTMDSTAIWLMAQTGTLDAYLRAIATGCLTPFWNRALLAVLSAAILTAEIFAVGTLAAAAFAAIFRHLGSGPTMKNAPQNSCAASSPCTQTSTLPHPLRDAPAASEPPKEGTTP